MPSDSQVQSRRVDGMFTQEVSQVSAQFLTISLVVSFYSFFACFAFSAEGMTSASLYRGSPVFATHLIADLRRQIQKGFAAKFMQRRPHLILLDQHFYRQSLLPLLALWTLLYLRSEGVNAASPAELEIPGTLPLPEWAQDGSVDRLLYHFLVTPPGE